MPRKSISEPVFDEHRQRWRVTIPESLSENNKRVRSWHKTREAARKYITGITGESDDEGPAAVIPPMLAMAPEEFGRVIDVNLKGVHLVIRSFLPAMIQRGTGVVVNFSSGWGRSTSPEVAAYCATKWGIEGLTAALAQELPAGLAAVALNPGIIDTRMLRSCCGEDASHYPTPEKWAKVAVPFLASLSVRHNGKSLTVPGM